jgi:glycosyltransferase involved in cell wall biosynthesis
MSEDGESSRTVLLISDYLPTDPGGRGEKLATRKSLLRDRGWCLVVCPVREPYVLTAGPSVLRGVRLARNHDADVIHSINNPFHLHLIGFFVSVLTGLPWLAELRDALTTDPDLEKHSVRDYARQFVEWLVVARATRIAWIDGIQLPSGYFRERYPDSSAAIERLPFIGFLSDHFEDVEPETYDTFTITYAGSFYPGWIEPMGFLDGLSRYLETTDRPDITVQFYGDWCEAYRDYAEAVGTTSAIRSYDFVPHEEIVPVLKGSDAVLYIGGDDPKNAKNIPSKIWDYIGSERPILAIVDPSFRVAEFIRTYELGIVAPPDDPDSIADAIRRLRDRQFEGPSADVSEQFSREKMVNALADVLDETYDEHT